MADTWLEIWLELYGWNIAKIWLDYGWNMAGIYLEYGWNMAENLAGIWFMVGIWLE